MKLLNIAPAVCGILTAGLLSASAQEKYDLKITWEPGKVYTFSQDIDTKMSMQGQDMQQKMKQTYQSSAEKVDKGVKVTMSFLKTSMKMDMAGQTMMDISSDDPEAMKKPEGAIIKQMLDLKMAATYDENSKLIGFEKIAGGGPMMDQVMSDDTLKQMMSQYDDYLPSKPISVGDSWDATTNMPMKELGGNLEMLMKMKLNEVTEEAGKKYAHISFSGSIKLAGEEQLLEMTAKKLEGTWIQDLQINQPKKVTTLMDMEMTAPGGVGKIPINMNMVMTLDSVKGAK